MERGSTNPSLLGHSHRWYNNDWLKHDLDVITNAFGPLPMNPYKKEGNPHQAFHKWMHATLKPETVDYVKHSDCAYAQTYAVFNSLAIHQARKPTA